VKWNKFNFFVFSKMATCKTNCCHSDGLKLPKSDRKRHKVINCARWNVILVISCSFFALVSVTWAQSYPQNPYLGDRDPRFYSRPGVDYRPTDPGDKDYR
jgi:hypothetical protein